MTEPPDKALLVLNIGLLALFGGVTILILNVSGNYQTGTLQTLIDAFVSILLTGAVVLIYYRIWLTDKEQTEIVRDQRDIADAMRDFQSRPALQTVDKNPVNYGWQIYLGNFGFGPAYDLNLEVDVHTDVEDYSPQSGTVQLERELSDSEADVSTNAILPKSEAELFTGEDIQVELEDRDSASLNTLFEELAIHGNPDDQITIDLSIRGRDALDNPRSCDAGYYVISVDDLRGVSEYRIRDVVSLERN